MSFNTALTSPQYTKIRRKSWQGNQLLSFCDNVIAFHALVASNLNSVGGSTTEAVPYTGVIAGAYTNIDQDMTVIISPNSDIRNPLAVRGRVNYQVADGTNVYCKEFSDPISSGAHIWVLYHYDILDVLSRPVGTNPVIQYKDYNRNFERMAPVIVGLQTGYAGWVDGSGNFDIPFDASASFAAESGRTITGYQYSVKATGSGSASVIAGAANTATVTYRFTAGEYWLKLVVTDSGSVTQFRHVLIKAHNRTNYLPQTGFDEVEITRDVQGGPSAHVKGYNGVSTLINGTIVIIWVDELYSDSDFSNASTTPIFNNIDMIGWIEAEENNYQTDLKYSALIDVSFEVQGVGARLARLEGQLLAFKNNASPSTWDDINNLTPWRAIVHFLQRHTTVLNLCDFTSDDTGNTFLFPTIVTLAGRALDNLTGNQGIAEEINAQLEFASDGRIQLIRREPFVFSNLGHTPLTIATWVSGQDFHTTLKWKFRHDVQYGYLSADGAFWDGSAAPVVPLLARAPGLAQASGADQGKLNNQILASTSSPTAAQGELSARAGVQYAMDNNTMELTCNHPAGYHWLQASYNQLYIWSLDSTFNIRGLSLDAGTSWMIKSVTVRHNNKEGDREVTASYIPVRTGTPAAPVPVINPNSISPAMPIYPTIPAMPGIELPELLWTDVGVPSSSIAPTVTKVSYDGQCVLEVNNNGASLSVSKNFIGPVPTLWMDVTPTLGSFVIKDACFNPFVGSGKAAIYVLASDGTNSCVFYSGDVFSLPWTQGTSYAGVYTVLRTGNVSGSVLIYGTSPGSSGSATVDPTIDISVANGSDTGMDFTSGDNIFITASGTVGGIGGGPYDPNGGCGYGSINTYVPSGSCYGSLIGRIGTVGAWFNVGTNFAGTAPATGRLYLGVTDTPGQYADNTGSYSANIFAGAAVARYSSDNSATFGSVLVIGPTPGAVGGFDAARASGVSVGSSQKAIFKASTAGGSYSSLVAFTTGTPTCLVVPYYRIGSDVTSQTTSSTPDTVYGLSAAESGSCLGFVDSGGSKVVITNPAVGATVPGQHCITTLRGTKMAVIVDVSGTKKLYVTENLAADGSCTWTFVKNVGASATLRCRRLDPRTGAHKGQLFLFDTTSGYSSQWAYNGEKDRVSPAGTIICGDILG